MQCAETSKKAFAILKESFANDAPEKGIVMMATVEGDIHDIGKNIVKVVVESYGYRVIDLGKDVKAETVVEAFRKYHPQAIGLSALMTTTLPAMEKTIRLLRQEADICPIWVGGAVLNEEYARTIHADHYNGRCHGYGGTAGKDHTNQNETMTYAIRALKAGYPLSARFDVERSVHH